MQVPIHIVIADVSDLAAVSRIPEELPSDFQDVDILVNNAGMTGGYAMKASRNYLLYPSNGEAGYQLLV